MEEQPAGRVTQQGEPEIPAQDTVIDGPRMTPGTHLLLQGHRDMFRYPIERLLA
jgi:hypothetical protein